MPPLRPQPRINVVQLKAQIVKKIGVERAHKYFYYLNRLLSRKLSKKDFNKRCYLTLGRENLPLHNRLIDSILKNAFQSESSPPTQERAPVNQNNSSIEPSNIYTNGDGSVKLHGSRLLEGHCNPLVNGKTCTSDGLSARALLGNAFHTSDKVREIPLQHESFSVNNKCSIDLVNIENTKVIDHFDISNFSKIPIKPPLGISFGKASVEIRCSLPKLGSNCEFSSSSNSGELPDTESLKTRMEQITRREGLDAVSMDCAVLLNNSVDAYIKQLIKSCIELVGAKAGHERIRNMTFKKQSYGKPINGAYPGQEIHMQEGKNHGLISLLDFKVAMELNSRQIGKSWPSLMEKISLKAYE